MEVTGIWGVGAFYPSRNYAYQIKSFFTSENEYGDFNPLSIPSLTPPSPNTRID